MRGRYYRDDFVGPDYVGNDTDSLPTSADLHEGWKGNPLNGIDAEANAIENRRKRRAGNGPKVVRTTDKPVNAADIRTIVRHVAFAILLNELDWSVQSLFEYHPALKGITPEQIRAVIAEETE